MKYQKRIHWDRHRPEFLKIGFIFSLAIALMAFNYTSAPPVYGPVDIIPLDFEEMVIPPITVHPKKALPPPPPEKIKIVDIEPTTEPILKFEEKVEFVEKVESGPLAEATENVVETAPIVDLIQPKDAEEDIILLFAERMPVYGECEGEVEENERRDCTNLNLLKHAYSHVRYPALARRNQIEGTVVVSFVVNKMGQVEDVKIVRDIGLGCGEEVVKAINELGQFLPGKQNGRPVSVLYRFPVKFKLQ